ncbi:MAG: ABC transporter ATP-binding protein/permease [Steroidobacteraceae bacterium]|jgi:vitamin B12/bleomycin/antimicrobial peptide transport system ATP-binding/permease protein
MARGAGVPACRGKPKRASGRLQDGTSAENSRSDHDEIAEAGLVSQVAMMSRGLWASPTRNKVALLAAGLFVVIAATAYGQIRLNSWNQPFYDALSHREFPQFLSQLGVFGIIAGALLVLNVAQRWLGEMLKLKLRQGLVHDLVQNWLVPGRALRIANGGDIGANPDQRMHEDARHLTELSADLGIGLLQGSILLITFIKILWGISSGCMFHVAGRSLAIPGYLVWVAFIYAASASLVSFWLGRSLIERNAERYAREAELRFSMVRVNEHIDAITLAGGEAQEARRIDLDLAGVLLATRRLLTGLMNLTWVTAGYGWFTLVAPILASAPLYFAGTLSFGGLMMASGAFVQVQSSLRWFVDNASILADWRATLLRVASFRAALLGADLVHPVERQIAFVEGEPGRIVMDHLEIASPSGRARFEHGYIEVKAGERVLIVGEAGAASTLLFRALAGLSLGCAGRVARPADETMLCIPRNGYLPAGTLREALAYPAHVAEFAAEAFPHALERLGLDHLVPMLDRSGRWDRILGEAEQQSLAFARAVIHAPAWLLIDHVFDTLDSDTRRRVYDVIDKDLAGSGVIHVGRTLLHGELFGRVLHLVEDPQARRSQPVGKLENLTTPLTPA